MANKRFITIGTIIVAMIFAVSLWRMQHNLKHLNSSTSKPALFSTQTKPIELDSGTFVAMGTLSHIKIIADSELQAIKALHAARQELKRLDALLSTYRNDSELSKINRLAAKRPIHISPDTYKLIKLSLKYSDLSNGAFDITVSPLIKLWKHSAEANQLPREKEILQAKSHIGYKKIILNETEHTIRFSERGISLTVDAIAKGFIIDYMLDAIKKTPGVRAALIEIGGEICCFGNRIWIIGIEDPFKTTKSNNPLQSLRWKIGIRNQAVATSGNYRRYFTIAGKQYSHIIDPHSGLPADKLPSVTVIAPTTASADALATTVSVLGPNAGLKLIESLSSCEAFIVSGPPSAPRIYKSSGMNDFLIR